MACRTGTVASGWLFLGLLACTSAVVLQRGPSDEPRSGASTGKFLPVVDCSGEADQIVEIRVNNTGQNWLKVETCSAVRTLLLRACVVEVAVCSSPPSAAPLSRTGSHAKRTASSRTTSAPSGCNPAASFACCSLATPRIWWVPVCLLCRLGCGADKCERVPGAGVLRAQLAVHPLPPAAGSRRSRRPSLAIPGTWATHVLVWDMACQATSLTQPAGWRCYLAAGGRAIRVS